MLPNFTKIQSSNVLDKDILFLLVSAELPSTELHAFI